MTVLAHEVTSGAVVITGGAGYIGSHTVLACRAVGRPVVVLDDLSRGNRRLLPAAVPFYEGDAGDPSMLAKIVERHSVEAVIHFAGDIDRMGVVTGKRGYVRGDLGGGGNNKK